MRGLLLAAALVAALLGAALMWLIRDAAQPNEIPLLSSVERDGGRVLVLGDGRWLEYFLLPVGEAEEEREELLLYQHGAFTTGVGLRPLRPRGWRVLACTVPGFGASTPLSHVASERDVSIFEQYAKDVAHVMTHEKLMAVPVVVYGASWGGSLGLAVASHLASVGVRVKGLLIGAPAMPASPSFEGDAKATSLAMNGVLQQFVMPSVFGPTVVKRLYRPLFWGSVESIAAMFGERPDTPGMEHLVADLRRSVRWWNDGQPDLLRHATTVRNHFNFSHIGAHALRATPIRIWHGDADKAILPAVSQYVLRELKAAGHADVELHYLPNGTHFSLMQLIDGPLQQLVAHIQHLEERATTQ